MRRKARKIASSIIKLLEAKNKSYKNSFLETREEFGFISLVIRLQDKVNRLKALANNPKINILESTEDTLKDIIGYCLLELLYRDNSL